MVLESVSRTEIQHALANFDIVLIGDSVMRTIYKDIVLHLQNSEDLLTPQQIATKGEASFCGDKLLHTNRNTGKFYREERIYQSDYFRIRFYFVTRVYDSYMEEIFQDFIDTAPDIVIFNSCLFDITRYGPNSVVDFEHGAQKLFKHLEMVLLPNCLFVWLSTLPVQSNAHNAFLLPRLLHRGHSIRLDLLEANYFIHELCYQYQRDFLDLNFHCRHLTLLHQLSDGLHWDGFANRCFSGFIVRYIADSLDIKLNHRLPLLELATKSLIHVDTSTESYCNTPPRPSVRQHSYDLSPESSSDWAKYRFNKNNKNKRSKEYSNDSSTHSPVAESNNLVETISSYSSQYIESLVSGIPDLPQSYLAKFKDKSNETSSFQPETAGNNTEISNTSVTNIGSSFSTNFPCLPKNRAQVSYGDLFEDNSPFNKKKKAVKDRIGWASTASTPSYVPISFQQNPPLQSPIKTSKTTDISSVSVGQNETSLTAADSKNNVQMKKMSKENSDCKNKNDGIVNRKRNRRKRKIKKPVVKEFSDASSYEEEESDEYKEETGNNTFKSTDIGDDDDLIIDIDDEDELLQPQISRSSTSAALLAGNQCSSNSANVTKKRNPFFSKFI